MADVSARSAGGRLRLEGQLGRPAMPSIRCRTGADTALGGSVTAHPLAPGAGIGPSPIPARR
jgi:hypothetical protein